jgi:hypothetical protein
MVRIRLVRLDRNLKTLLEERHQLDRGEGIEDSSRDERRRRGQIRRLLPREEFGQDEVPYRIAHMVHFRVSLRTIS